MKFFRARSGRSLFLVMVLFTLALAPAVLAQDDKPAAPEKKTEEINLETQLYMLVGTNQDVAEARLPAALDPVIKELRASLPFKNYRLMATLINRVKSEGRLDLRWIGGPLLETASPAGPIGPNPTFSDFVVRQVKLVQDAQGHNLIRMDGFKFGSRIPIQMSAQVAANNTPPTFNYESTGLNTDISMREGEPVIVGTLNVGPSGDAIILVVSAKRAMK